MKFHYLLLLHFSVFRLVDVTVIAQSLLESAAIRSVDFKSWPWSGNSIKGANSG